MQTNGIEMVRHCKNYVIVLNGQGTLHQVVDPEGLLRSLALRTVPVTATVIAIAYCATIITYLFVSAKGRGTALHYFAQHFYLQRSKSRFCNHAGAE